MEESGGITLLLSDVFTRGRRDRARGDFAERLGVFPGRSSCPAWPQSPARISRLRLVGRAVGTVEPPPGILPQCSRPARCEGCGRSSAKEHHARSRQPRRPPATVRGLRRAEGNIRAQPAPGYDDRAFPGREAGAAPRRRELPRPPRLRERPRLPRARAPTRPVRSAHPGVDRVGVLPAGAPAIPTGSRAQGPPVGRRGRAVAHRPHGRFFPRPLDVGRLAWCFRTALGRSDPRRGGGGAGPRGRAQSLDPVVLRACRAPSVGKTGSLRIALPRGVQDGVTRRPQRRRDPSPPADRCVWVHPVGGSASH